MNIIVTGCSKGIGYSTVMTLGRDFHHNIIGVSRDTEKLKELKRLIGINFHPLEFDLSTLPSHEEDFLKKIKAIVPSIDILINNAAILHKNAFVDISSEQALKQFEVNFFSPAALIRLLIPMMGKSHRSHVVNISSMGGFQGSKKYSGLSYYSASKAALATLTECLAEEYKDQRIAFNCLALGSVQTDMLEQAFPGLRVSVTPDEMGAFIADFAIHGHAIYNGRILPVSRSIP